MSTRSLIVKDKGNDRYDAIYCHFDGYPGHMVPALKNSLKIEGIDNIIPMKYLSSIKPDGELVCDNPNPSDHAYNKNMSLNVLKAIAEECGAEYIYFISSSNRIKVKSSNYGFNPPYRWCERLNKFQHTSTSLTNG